VTSPKTVASERARPASAVPASDAVGALHLLEPPLAGGAELEVILEELAEECARVVGEALLELAVGERLRLAAPEPAQEPLEQPPRSGEGVGLCGPEVGVAPKLRCSAAIGQEIVARRVIFASKGVGTGGHVATSVVCVVLDNAGLRRPSCASSPRSRGRPRRASADPRPQTRAKPGVSRPTRRQEPLEQAAFRSLSSPVRQFGREFSEQPPCCRAC